MKHSHLHISYLQGTFDCLNNFVFTFFMCCVCLLQMNHINEYVFFVNFADCKLERFHNQMNKLFYSISSFLFTYKTILFYSPAQLRAREVTISNIFQVDMHN